jgi:integrase
MTNPGQSVGYVLRDVPVSARENTAPCLTLSELGSMMREAMKHKSWEDTSLGGDVAAYLRAKHRRLTDASYGSYESCLDKLCWYFVGLDLVDLEPPIGTERVEEFLEHQWGKREPRTYNKNLSILHDFFKHCVRRGLLRGDPSLIIEPARARQVYRTTFTADQRRALVAQQESRRDRLGLRLLLDYGLRKGALGAIQFKHFDHQRKRLTIFTKGAKVREMPIPHVEFWLDLERHILDVQAEPHHYLMCQRTRARRGFPKSDIPEKPMSPHGLHLWWYRCLANAGIVPDGTTSGERMHKARHTAGQRMLDTTGNLKAVQVLLGHASIQTTGDIYTSWDDEQLMISLAQVQAEDQG